MLVAGAEGLHAFFLPGLLFLQARDGAMSAAELARSSRAFSPWLSRHLFSLSIDPKLSLPKHNAALLTNAYDLSWLMLPTFPGRVRPVIRPYLAWS